MVYNSIKCFDYLLLLLLLFTVIIGIIPNIDIGNKNRQSKYANQSTFFFFFTDFLLFAFPKVLYWTINRMSAGGETKTRRIVFFHSAGFTLTAYTYHPTSPLLIFVAWLLSKFPEYYHWKQTLPFSKQRALNVISWKTTALSHFLLCRGSRGTRERWTKEKGERLYSRTSHQRHYVA